MSRSRNAYAGAVGPAKTGCCVFSAAGGILLAAVMAAGLLGVSNPARAKTSVFQKFHSKKFADDYARGADKNLRNAARIYDCPLYIKTAYYIKTARYYVKKYQKKAATNKKKLHDLNKELTKHDMKRRQSTDTSASAMRKASFRRRQIIGRIRDTKSEGEDIDAALKDLKDRIKKTVKKKCTTPNKQTPNQALREIYGEALIKSKGRVITEGTSGTSGGKPSTSGGKPETKGTRKSTRTGKTDKTDKNAQSGTVVPSDNGNKNKISYPARILTTETTAGAAFGTMHPVEAGTVGDPGSETSLTRSEGTLTGASIGFGGEIPLTEWPEWLRGMAEAGGWSDSFLPANSFFPAKKRAATLPGGGYQFTPRIEYGAYFTNLRGTNKGEEREGGRNVAFTFIVPNPATGATGINAGATGEAASIETRIRMVSAYASLALPVAGGLLGKNGVWAVSGEVGAQYDYTWDMNTIDQNSLAFPGLSSRTELTADEHAFAARMGVNVMAQKGPFYGSLGAYTAPGYVHSRGTAEQNILCNVCGNPADRDFTLNLEDARNEFVVRTGVTLKFGAFVSDHALVDVKGRYEFTSRMGGFSNPTSPTQQPARFDTHSAQNWSIGVEFKYVF